jgi:predicted phage tail protein
MGGQACVFYGAAQFSKDIDFLILSTRRILKALKREMEEFRRAERAAS